MSYGTFPTGTSSEVNTITALADLLQDTFVGFDGDVCAANAKAYGIAVYDIPTGKDGPVMTDGKWRILLSGTVSIKDPIASDAAGKGVKASTFAVSIPSGSTAMTSTSANPTLTESGGVLPQFINAFALEAGVPGQVIMVEIYE